MKALLLDTNAWAWSFADPARLTPAARDALLSAETVYVSPISFFEIAQKVRIGKWPEMAPMLARLPAILQEQGGTVAAMTSAVALRAGSMDWPHRDPFDRFIAATAIEAALPVVSSDAVFDGIVSRIW